MKNENEPRKEEHPHKQKWQKIRNRKENYDEAPVVAIMVVGPGGGIGFTEPPPVEAALIGRKEFEVGDTVGVDVEGGGAPNSLESLKAISSLLVEAGVTGTMAPFVSGLTGVE